MLPSDLSPNLLGILILLDEVVCPASLLSAPRSVPVLLSSFPLDEQNTSLQTSQN